MIEVHAVEPCHQLELEKPSSVSGRILQRQGVNFALFCSGLSTYLAFLNGKVPIEALLPLYEGVDAVTDQPTCHLWPILLQLFPDAKVTL